MLYPRADLFDLCKVSDATFWPMNRQELTRTAGAATQAKDLGPPLWRASFTTAAALRRENAADIEAALISLRGSAGSFLAHDLRYPFPRAHPGGYAGAITIDALNPANAFEVDLAAAAGGLELRPGDYIGFQFGARPSYALHRVTVGATLTAPGAVATVEVFPAIMPGAAAGAPVTVNRASCEMILEPGQTPPTGRDFLASSVTFSGVQIF